MQGARGLARQKDGGSLPADPNALRDVLQLHHPNEDFLFDPYDGHPSGYAVREDQALVWSAGPDGESGMDDNLVIDSLELD